jgi:hypothetical protein
MTTKIKAGVIGDNVVGITQLNVSDGSDGQVLQTNGSGTLSFATISGTTINNNADNRIITGSGTANTLNGEANFVFDGSNVGIGTSSPNSYSGYTSLTLNGTTGSIVDLEVNGTVTGELYSNVNNGVGIQAIGSRHIQFKTNNVERMRIDSSGNVGIGTASPDALLEVSNITANDIPFFISGGTASLGSLPETTGMAFGYGSAAGYKKGAILWEFIATNGTGKLHFCNDGAADDGNAQLSDSKMTIDSTGNVGIGTTSPADTLHVKKSSTAVGEAILTVEGGSGGYGTGISFQSVLTGGSLAEMAKIVADGEAAWNTTASNQDAGLRFFTTGDGTSAERMRIQSSGLITAGTSTSAIGKNIRNWSTTGYMELSGDLPGYSPGSYPVLKSSSAYLYISVGNSYSSYISTNGVYTVQSDANLKTNINTLPLGQLNKITNLRGVTYNWIDENKGTETQTGLIAQEVEAEYPEFVTSAAGDLKGVNYAGLVAPLIEAVKELKLELDAAKARITTLEG